MKSKMWLNINGVNRMLVCDPKRIRWPKCYAALG